MYQVIDNQTNCAVGKPMISKQRARNKADRLDLEYGAIRYSVKGPVEPLPVTKRVSNRIPQTAGEAERFLWHAIDHLQENGNLDILTFNTLRNLCHDLAEVR